MTRIAIILAGAALALAGPAWADDAQGGQIIHPRPHHHHHHPHPPISCPQAERQSSACHEPGPPQ